jgi:AcrR family transcriptional regulator
MAQLRAQPRQDRSATSIEDLLDAAASVFAERGVADTTTVHIAERAGVSVGRLYYWFKDKQTLAEALSRRTQERLRVLIDESLVDVVELPTGELVRRIVRMFAEFVARNPSALSFLAQRGTDASIGDAGSSFRRHMIDLVKAMVAARVADVTDLESELVATALIEVLVGMLSSATLETGPASAFVEEELVYLITAYLYARYPAADDNVWNDPRHPVQPARPARTLVSGKNSPLSPQLP